MSYRLFIMGMLPGNLEIKKTPRGFLIQKNGDTIEISEAEKSFVLTALVNALHAGDFDFITNILPSSFMSEKLYSDADNQLRDKRIIFISDLTDFTSRFKSILEGTQAVSPECFGYDDENIFSREADFIVAFHHQPRNTFFLKLNSFCLDNNIRFIKAMTDNFQFIVTPFLAPHESACYNCYRHLKALNGVFDKDTLEAEDFIHGGSLLPDFMLHFCAGFLAVMLVRFLTLERLTRDDSAETVLDFRNIEISKNPLLKVPVCNACSRRP